MDPRLNAFLGHCLLLDLETGPNGTIHKIGAVRGDRTFQRQGRFDIHAALAELDSFATGCDLLLGHNLLGHDLPTLSTLAPVLALLRRPVVDTRYLSPLALLHLQGQHHLLPLHLASSRDYASIGPLPARLQVPIPGPWLTAT